MFIELKCACSAR